MLLIVLAASSTASIYFDIRGRAAGPQSTMTANMAIATSKDRANQDGGQMEIKNSKTNWIGNANSLNRSFLGLRFTGDAIPAGAKIQSATLEITSSKTDWEHLNIAIYAEQASNSSPFSASQLISSRVLTNTSTIISLDQKWVINQRHTFNVTSPVKSLIGANGNNGIVTLIIAGRGKSYDYYFFYNEMVPNKAPKLKITYSMFQNTTPAPTGIPTPSPTYSLPSPTGVIIPTPTATPTIPATPPPVSTTEIWRPPMNVSWHWMIDHKLDFNNGKDMGTLDPSGNPVKDYLGNPVKEPDVYDIDGYYNGYDPNHNILDVNGKDSWNVPDDTITRLHQMGKKVICYVDLGVYEDYRPDAYKFPKSVIGKADIGWAGSYWLDIRQINILLPIMTARMKMCKDKGFDAIEPDEMVNYSNPSGFPLTYQDQINYNIAIANAAHGMGMSIGLKDDIEQSKDLVNYFDWNLNEECYQYNECEGYEGGLSLFVKAGKPVFVAEYQGQTSNFCPKANAQNYNAIKFPLNLNGGRYPCRNSPPMTVSPTPTVPGFEPEDINHDNCINIMDFNHWFTAALGNPFSNSYPDINKDGKVDIVDFNYWFMAIQAGKKSC